MGLTRLIRAAYVRGMPSCGNHGNTLPHLNRTYHTYGCAHVKTSRRTGDCQHALDASGNLFTQTAGGQTQLKQLSVYAGRRLHPGGRLLATIGASTTAGASTPGVA